MRCAIVIHPNNIEQIRQVYPWLKRVPAKMALRFLHFLPPADAGAIETAGGLTVHVLCCPLLPHYFSCYAPEYLWQKIRACLLKAERMGALVVGLDGMTASFLDEGFAKDKPVKAVLTTGLRIRTGALMEEIRLTALRQGISWPKAEILLAGAAGQEGKTWAVMLAKESGALTLLRSEVGRNPEFAHKIIYEMGLALRVTEDLKTAMEKADIVFLHRLLPDKSIELSWFKKGALVCSIIPNRGWADLLMKRSDITYIDNPGITPPPGITWPGGLVSSENVSAALAETICLTLEKCDEFFGPGREITIIQIQAMTKLAAKYGFGLGKAVLPSVQNLDK